MSSVSLIVGSREIQVHCRRRGELDLRPLLVYLFQEQTGYHSRWGLVEIMPVGGPISVGTEPGRRILFIPDIAHCLLLACVFLGTNKEVLVLCLATWDLHELVEFKNPFLATCPPFGAFMEQRLAWMEHAFFSFPRWLST